jgi:hypothetical protein
MKIKATFLVTDMCFNPTYDCVRDESTDHKTEVAAMKAAKEMLNNSEGQDAEVWVWKLTHVLSKPEADPVIDEAA